MEEKNIITENTIAAIILCEPITKKGRDSLDLIGLKTSDVSPDFYLDEICVKSKYDPEIPNSEINIEETEPSESDSYLLYQYLIAEEQFKNIKEKYRQFLFRLSSRHRDESPLLILGVAGNGKTIEINLRIHKLIMAGHGVNFGSVYLNLEESFTRLRSHGVEYNCPIKEDPKWLFCIKLLEGVFNYIKKYSTRAKLIRDNFYKYIKTKGFYATKHIDLFDSIGSYNPNKSITEAKVLQALIGLLSSQKAEDDIEALLEVLLWIMFCSDPKRLNFIIFDNIEDYIKLDEMKIQIPNSSLVDIYSSINRAFSNTVKEFDKIKENLGWESFKIIIALRRTSLNMLGLPQLHNTAKTENNSTDFTGYFQVYDIWLKKKEYIWKNLLRERFKADDPECDIKISLVDDIMGDGDGTLGTSYQSIISPMMSYGIRRNARAQAHAASQLFAVLFDKVPIYRNNSVSIDLETYRRLLSNANSENAVMYMFRRALLEFQFKWQIASEAKERWQNLGIGHLEIKYHNGQIVYPQEVFSGKRINYLPVKYNDTSNISLFRRVLSYLSYFPENGGNKSVDEMFKTRSLFEVIENVLLFPSKDNLITLDDLRPLAKVLTALSYMSFHESKSAPFVILNVKDNEFHASQPDEAEERLALLLEKIWNSGPAKSLSGKEFDSKDFGARITDAGNSFLLDWLPSYSFIAALYCHTMPPLFFLKDVISIKYTIRTVYNKANLLCRYYEDEAERFCGPNNNLSASLCLPKNNGDNGDQITFRKRVQDLHVWHLNLYKQYINKNYETLGLMTKDREDLENWINTYIRNYRNWNTNEGARKCF